MSFQTVNPIHYKGWDDLLLAHEQATFFHSSAWARVLNESYGYTPLYFTAFQNGSLISLLPFMEIRSILTGKRAVSLPFSDYCEPIIARPGLFPDALNAVREHGKKAGWKFVELRGGSEYFNETAPSSSWHRHTLGLSKDDAPVFSRLRDSTRRNINKAAREGVRVTFSASAESVREFYRLNCLTRKRHGLPPQPYFFFKSVYEHILRQGHGTVALAGHRGAVIAAALYLQFGKKALYKYGASDSAHQHLRANNLIMWEALQWYSQRGYATFCFGRTEPQNSGLLQFKRGWGARECTVHYYRYDMKKNSFLQEASMTRGMHTRLLKRLPSFCLRAAGSLLYRHIG